MEKIYIQQIKDIVVDDVEQSIPEHFEDFKNRLDSFAPDPLLFVDDNPIEMLVADLMDKYGGKQTLNDFLDEEISIGGYDDPYEIPLDEKANNILIRIKNHETGEIIVTVSINDIWTFRNGNSLPFDSNLFRYRTDDTEFTGYVYRVNAPDVEYDVIGLVYDIHDGKDLQEQIDTLSDNITKRLDNIGEGDQTAQWDTLERQFSRLWSFMWGDEPDSDANDEDTRIGNSADPYELWFSEENTYIRLSIKIHGSEDKLVDTGFNPRQYVGSNHALTLGSGNYQFQYYTHPDECWHGYLYRTTAVDTDYDIVWQSYTSHNGSLQDQIENIYD